jgi:hypothetical protein
MLSQRHANFETENISINNLFGNFCSDWLFRHDEEMQAWRANRKDDASSQQTHTTTTNSQASQMVSTSPEQARVLSTEAKLGDLPTYSNVVSRPFDQTAGQTSLTPGVKATPPREIVAVSPNSASQNLRRKAIHEQLQDGEVKRIRRSYDRSPSSGATEEIRQLAVQKVDDNADSESSFEDVTLGASEVVELRDARIPRSPEPHEPGSTTGTPASDDEDWSNRKRVDNQQPHGFDTIDKVWRCLVCGHELWGGSEGFCTGYGCEAETRDNPYMEVLDPEAPPLPEIALDDETDELLDGEVLKTTVGPCLDYDSSAYDSMDSDLEFQEEYNEKDSFIDDSVSLDAEDESQDDDPTGDEEPDYEAMYRQLRATHSELINDYVLMDDEFTILRREIGIDDDSGDVDDADMDDEDMDEDGMYIVEVKNPDPVITEIVISHTFEESQESEITEDRIQARATAFEAAERPSGWHDVEMMSTANHTLPEIEL